MTDWRDLCTRMDRLLALQAPACVRAHLLVRLLIPRLAVAVGVREFTTELAALLADGLCAQTSTCFVCKTVKADGGDGLCCKCRAEVDQYAAGAGL